MKRPLTGLAGIIGVLAFSVVVALAQSPGGSEHESHHPVPPSRGMGTGMMGGHGMIGNQGG